MLLTLFCHSDMFMPIDRGGHFEKRLYGDFFDVFDVRNHKIKGDSIN